MQILKENIGSKISDFACSNIFFPDISPQTRETEEKNKQIGLHQTKTFFLSEGKHQQNENKTH